MTLKLCLGAKLSCRLGEEPYPRAPDGLMPGRRTAGSREAGGGADCHADFGERIRSGWRKAREPRVASRWLLSTQIGEKTEILYCNCNCDTCWCIEIVYV